MAPWPTELHLKRAERILEIAFDDGLRFALPAELLRVESPSAEVRGHNAAERRIPGGKRGVGIDAVEPVGHYAVRLRFDDGHDSGIYTWVFLRELGQTQDERWAAYHAALAERGLSRD